MNDSNETNVAEVKGEYKVKKTKGLDIAAKIMSVVVAFVLWLYAVNAESPVYENTINGVDVAIENLSSELSVISGDGDTVDITVKGKRNDVLKLTASDITAYVDTSSVSEAGIHTLPVSVTLPNGISLVDVYPESISLYLGTTTSKQLPISIDLRNYTVDAGYILESSSPDISYVTVRGPSDELAKITEAKVTIEPGLITSSITASGSVELYDIEGHIYSNPYVTSSVSDVLVRIDIHMYKTVPLKVDYKYGYYNENNVEITLSPSTVKLKGSVENLRDIESIDVMTIDETEITADGSIVAHLTLPADIVAADGANNVTISIKHKNTVTKTFAVTHFTLQNTPDGKTCSVSTSTLNVTLRGAVGEYFTYFTSDDINIVLDMKNYAEVSGVVTVPAKIVINNGSDSVIIYAIGSYSATVTVS